MPKLEDWQVGKWSSNPYKAPELWTWKLQGKIYNHPNFNDGEMVTTSEIVKLDVDARKATTRSGTEYELGNPNPQWIDWLQEQGYNLWEYNR